MSRNRAGNAGYTVPSARRIELSYKGRLLKQVYEPDFTCREKIIVEIKAVSEPGGRPPPRSTTTSAAMGTALAFLVNFANYPKLQWERISTPKIINHE